MNIFISYRRDDSGDITGRIYDRLVTLYGRRQVFRDVTSLEGGQRFPARLENAITEQTVMLVVIGRHWLAMTEQRRDDPYDFGRIEIEIALRQHATIIPVLVHGAQMPTQEQLPPSITDLANYHSLTVRGDPDFPHDVEQVHRAVGLYVHLPRRSFPWIGATSILLLVAIGAGVVVHFGLLPLRTSSASTPTSTLPLYMCTSNGEYPDSPSYFGPNPSLTSPPLPAASPGFSRESLSVIGGGDGLQIVSDGRPAFDQVNSSCTLIDRQGSLKGLAYFQQDTTDHFAALVTDVSLPEVRALNLNGIQPDLLGTLPDPHQDLSLRLGVIPEILVVSTNVAKLISSLTLAQITAIYRGNITNWQQVNGPPDHIDATWPGDPHTAAGALPGNQTDLNSVSSVLIPFKRDIMHNAPASSSLDFEYGIGQQGILQYVSSHPDAIGFASLESLLFYRATAPTTIANAIPIGINGFSPAATLAPTASTMTLASLSSIANAINKATYPFWDEAHIYVKSPSNLSGRQSSMLTALEEYLISESFRDYAFLGLGWVSVEAITPSLLDCHDTPEVCS